jgi:hypothetical protein
MDSRGVGADRTNEDMDLKVKEVKEVLSIYTYHLSSILYYLSISISYSSRLYPASFPAGRIPPCGGIAHP